MPIFSFQLACSCGFGLSLFSGSHSSWYLPFLPMELFMYQWNFLRLNNYSCLNSSLRQQFWDFFPFCLSLRMCCPMKFPALKAHTPIFYILLLEETDRGHSRKHSSAYTVDFRAEWWLLLITADKGHLWWASRLCCDQLWSQLSECWVQLSQWPPAPSMLQIPIPLIHCTLQLLVVFSSEFWPPPATFSTLNKPLASFLITSLCLPPSPPLPALLGEDCPPAPVLAQDKHLIMRLFNNNTSPVYLCWSVSGLAAKPSTNY